MRLPSHEHVSCSLLHSVETKPALTDGRILTPRSAILGAPEYAASPDERRPASAGLLGSCVPTVVRVSCGRILSRAGSCPRIGPMDSGSRATRASSPAAGARNRTWLPDPD